MTRRQPLGKAAFPEATSETAWQRDESLLTKCCLFRPSNKDWPFWFLPFRVVSFIVGVGRVHESKVAADSVQGVRKRLPFFPRNVRDDRILFVRRQRADR